MAPPTGPRVSCVNYLITTEVDPPNIFIIIIKVINRMRQNLACSSYGFPLNTLQLTRTKDNKEVKIPLVAPLAPAVAILSYK
jgi:hypothetical protein